jgi:iron complex transport system substrate-binding protein
MMPAATEIVAALGCANWLVARSHECDFPPEVAHLPACTRSRVDATLPCAQIDRDVKNLLGQALSIYDVDGDLLMEVRPDLIITQSQCDVCAVSPRDVERALGQQLPSCPRMLSLAPARLEDIIEDVGRVAVALGMSRSGELLMDRLRRQLAGVQARAATSPARPRVACIEWIEPLMGAGNWVPELVERAGGVPVLGAAGQHSGWISLEDLASQTADVMIIMPCGFSIDRTRQELNPLWNHPCWPALTAVKNNEVYLVDGHHYFNRPGPRIVESAEILFEILHPDAADPRHQGRGWQRL